MTFGVIMWLVGIVGSLGLAGVVAMYFGAIAVPAVISTVAMKIVEKIIGCKVCMVVLLVAVTSATAWYSGWHQSSKHYKAREKAAQELARRADLEAAHAAADNEKKLLTEIQKVKSERDKANDDYIAALASRPSPACTFEDADVGPSATARVVAGARSLPNKWLNRWRGKKPTAAAKPNAGSKPAKSR